MRKKYACWASLFFLYLATCMSSCQDEKIDSGEYDPSKPVVFTDFTPDEGGIRTAFYITGENFGNDPSKVRISIGGKVAHTIGCNNNEIYCMVPRHAYDEVVKVSMLSADGKTSIIDYEFEKRFTYTPQISVGTLCGKVDEKGDAADVNGSFEDARFNNPEWLMLDTFGIEKSLYILSPSNSLRKIDLDKEFVSTLITNGQGSFKSMRNTTFDTTGDTIFVSDDNGQNNKDKREIAYLLRSENFRKAKAYVYDRCGYSCAYHPLDQTLYYNTYWKAGLQKAVFNPETNGMVGQEVFPVYESRDSHSYLHIHPKGNYMYILGSNCVFKSMYNKETKKFQSPVILAGKLAEESYVDGPGTSARFGEPFQGTFVKNEDYVKAGKADIYDFYLCDRKAHCIRKVTPEGIVSTFAGRGSVSSDGKVEGYIDGDLRKEARFKKPSGIAYNERTQTFYIADVDNHRIRTISVE